MTTESRFCEALDTTKKLKLLSKDRDPITAKFLAKEEKDLLNSVKFLFKGDPPPQKSGYYGLPFDKCFYELVSPLNAVYGYLLRQINENTITGTIYRDTINGFVEPQGIKFHMEYEPENDRFRVASHAVGDFAKLYDQSELTTLAKHAYTNVLLFSSLCTSSNVKYVDNPIRQKNKVSKRKRHLFEYKTLEIVADREINVNKGTGTHASPCVHLRRGHIRKLKSGKTVWVQPAVVGDKDKGVKVKDYVISSGKTKTLKVA